MATAIEIQNGTIFNILVGSQTTQTKTVGPYEDFLINDIDDSGEDKFASVIFPAAQSEVCTCLRRQKNYWIRLNSMGKRFQVW